MTKEQREPDMIAPAPPLPSIWNPVVALKRMDNDRGLLASLVEYFFEDTPVLLNELPLAILRTDAPEATRAAHSIKGLCANFEAIDAISSAHQMEKACREGNFDLASRLLPLLHKRIDELRVSLAEWTTAQESSGNN